MLHKCWWLFLVWNLRLLKIEEEMGDFVVCYHSLYVFIPDVGFSQISTAWGNFVHAHIVITNSLILCTRVAYCTWCTTCIKEKLPQAFKCKFCEWSDFRIRNLHVTVKIWANVDNPIKRWFSKFWLISCTCMYAALSGGTLLHSVMSQQYNCLKKINGTLHKFHQILLFPWKHIFPSGYFKKLLSSLQIRSVFG